MNVYHWNLTTIRDPFFFWNVICIFLGKPIGCIKSYSKVHLNISRGPFVPTSIHSYSFPWWVSRTKLSVGCLIMIAGSQGESSGSEREGLILPSSSLCLRPELNMISLSARFLRFHLSEYLLNTVADPSYHLTNLLLCSPFYHPFASL